MAMTLTPGTYPISGKKLVVEINVSGPDSNDGLKVATSVFWFINNSSTEMEVHPSSSALIALVTRVDVEVHHMMHHVQEMELKVVMVVQVVLIHHQMETHLVEHWW